jgi:hypothetical protein
MKTLLAIVALALTSAQAQTWRFTCDYVYLDNKGRISRRERVSALYTRGQDGTVRWNGVTVAKAPGETAGFGPAQDSKFMEGFSYAHGATDDMLGPDFFHGFPAMAMQERNLVWDTNMIEGFSAKLGSLEPNVPYHAPDVSSVPLGGTGSFHHKDLQLILTGATQRNGQDCAVVDYLALFNTLEMRPAPGMTLTAGSNYWGQVTIAKRTGRIEYATLYESVLGELALQGQEKPMTVNVFRIGRFEPVEK